VALELLLYINKIKKEDIYIDHFRQWRENQYLKPTVFENKDKFYIDLFNIEESWTGRADAQIVNTFMLESNQLIINAIVLFEKGYFDCAYYSLRQSLELATTMVYLTELDIVEKENKLKEWKSKKDFPMIGKMLTFLNNNQDVYRDIYEKMEPFFKNLKTEKNKMNKYVHKQGYDTFYLSKINKS